MQFLHFELYLSWIPLVTSTASARPFNFKPENLLGVSIADRNDRHDGLVGDIPTPLKKHESFGIIIPNFPNWMEQNVPNH